MSTVDERNEGGPRRTVYADDEITLTDLVMVVWRNRFVTIIIAALVVGVSVIYAFTEKPTYKATTYVLPPLEQHIEEINKAKRFGLSGYSRKGVFDDLLVNLKSKEIRREFFFDNGLLDYFSEDPQIARPTRVFENSFDRNLVVEEPRKGETGPASIMLTMGDRERSADLLNRFVAMVERKTIDQMVDNITADIEAEAAELKIKTTSLRSMAKRRREDQVVALQEALRIARKLGIEKPSDYNFDIARKQLDAVSVNTAELPLYARGTTALEAEIEALQSRTNDDPFIDGLRDLEQELAALEGITIDPAKVKTMRVDRPAVTPYTRESPNRKLIAVIGILMGGFIGVLAAFLVEFVRNFRAQLKGG